MSIRHFLTLPHAAARGPARRNAQHGGRELHLAEAKSVLLTLYGVYKTLFDAIYNGVLYKGAPFNGALYIMVHH